MSSARPRQLAVLLPAVAAGFGLTLLLGGCGVGQITQMSEQEAAVNGANGDAGPINVRNAHLVFPSGNESFYPAGSDAPLVAVIANSGTTEDELTSVTSPAAGSVRVDGQRTIPAQRTARAVAGEDGATPASALEQGQIGITLEDLTQDVKPGRTIRVTLLFRQSGEVVLEVPIGAPDEPTVQ